MPNLRLQQYLRLWAQEAGILRNSFTLVWGVNPSLMRLLQNPKLEKREASICNCDEFPEEFKTKGCVVTDNSTILRCIGCSEDIISVLENMDQANFIVTCEDWFTRAAKK